MSIQRRAGRNVSTGGTANETAHASDANISPADAPAALMEPLATLRASGEAVTAIGVALGLPPDRLAAAEALDRLEVEASLTLDAVAAWTPRAVSEWFAILESDLQLDLRLAGLDSHFTVPEAALRFGHGPTNALDEFVEAARTVRDTQGDDVEVVVRLSLAKRQRVAAARACLTQRPDYLGSGEMRERTTVAVFFYAAAWHRLLSIHALGDWEQRGLARRDGRAYVVLCDAAGYLGGVALDVLGAQLEEAPRWLELSRAGWRHFEERAEETRRLRDTEGTWENAPHVLTPAHLRLEMRTPGLEATAERLTALHRTLAAAYLASSVRREVSGDLVLHFAGARPSTCRLSRAQALDTGAAPHEDATGRLATWSYQGASPDKLAIARECLARELPAGQIVSLADVERAAGPAREAARANFALYLRGKTEQYFQARQRAFDAVDAYTETVRKTVNDLTSDVVDTVYRTAGLLAAVFIAGLVQPEASLGVRRLATLVYIAYLALVLLLVMSARWRRYTQTSADLHARLAGLPELGHTERVRLQSQASGANGDFERYFRWSCGVFAGLGLVGILYFIVLWTPLGGAGPAVHHILATATPTAATR